jgi:cold shock protein
MSFGTVCTWNEERGFGFIKPDEGGADVFVHAKSVIGASMLHPSQRVEYDAVFQPASGKYRASDCRVI